VNHQLQIRMMPPCVRGVINLRGAVVSAMDLQALSPRAGPAEVRH
jgi:chemotaxis signal transduction protein